MSIEKNSLENGNEPSSLGAVSGSLIDKPKNILLCRKCYNPHILQDEDAGNLREELRLCVRCFNDR